MALTLDELMAGKQRLAEQQQQEAPERMTLEELGQLQSRPSAEPVDKPTRAGPLTKLVPSEPVKPPSLSSRLKESALTGIREFLGVVPPDTDEAPDRQGKGDANAVTQKIFEEFSRLVLQQQDLLLDATKEQTEIFKKLEQTIDKLKTAGREDADKLRKSIEVLTAQLKATKPETQAKQRVTRAVAPVAAATTPRSAESKARTSAPAVTARSAAVPAVALAPTLTPTNNMNLFEDAGLISSESEGDKVQTGEREADMATILGFLGNLMGGDGGGVLPIGNPFGKGGPRGGPVGGPGGAGADKYKDKSGRWRDARGRYTTPPAPVSKPSWWERIKDFGKSTGNKVKTVGGGLLEAGSLTRGLGLGALIYSTELGNGELTAADRANTGAFGGSPDLAQLQAQHEAIQKEMYQLVTTPSDDRDRVNARIKQLNAEAAENVRQQNLLRQPETMKPNSQVLEQSMTNKTLTSQPPATAPVIINNQQNVGSKQPPAYIAPSLETRPKESALDRYINRETVY